MSTRCSSLILLRQQIPVQRCHVDSVRRGAASSFCVGKASSRQVRQANGLNDDDSVQAIQDLTPLMRHSGHTGEGFRPAGDTHVRVFAVLPKVLRDEIE